MRFELASHARIGNLPNPIMANKTTIYDADWLLRAVDQLTRTVGAGARRRRRVSASPLPVVELAVRIGVHPSTIFRWLSGESMPTRVTVDRVAAKVRKLLGSGGLL